MSLRRLRMIEGSTNDLDAVLSSGGWSRPSPPLAGGTPPPLTPPLPPLGPSVCPRPPGVPPLRHPLGRAEEEGLWEGSLEVKLGRAICEEVLAGGDPHRGPVSHPQRSPALPLPLSLG